MKRITIDTNAYRRLLEGEDPELLQIINRAHRVFLSVIVLGELIAGFKGGTKEKENKDMLEQFLLEPTVETLHVRDETAEIYGEVKNELLKKGTPIPTNDLWIASQVVETASVLITYDRHFIKISGLRIWDRLKTK